MIRLRSIFRSYLVQLFATTAGLCLLIALVADRSIPFLTAHWEKLGQLAPRKITSGESIRLPNRQQVRILHANLGYRTDQSDPILTVAYQQFRDTDKPAEFHLASMALVAAHYLPEFREFSKASSPSAEPVILVQPSHCSEKFWPYSLNESGEVVPRFDTPSLLAIIAEWCTPFLPPPGEIETEKRIQLASGSRWRSNQPTIPTMIERASPTSWFPIVPWPIRQLHCGIDSRRCARLRTTSHPNWTTSATTQNSRTLACFSTMRAGPMRIMTRFAGKTARCFLNSKSRSASHSCRN